MCEVERVYLESQLWGICPACSTKWVLMTHQGNECPHGEGIEKKVVRTFERSYTLKLAELEDGRVVECVS